MIKTTKYFLPEVRVHAVRLVLDNDHERASCSAANVSVVEKIGCTAKTLNEWIKKAEVDAGKRAVVPTDKAARRSLSISSCSSCICPCPGKVCTGSDANSLTHLRRTFSRMIKSRVADATQTPRSLISRTDTIWHSRPTNVAPLQTTGLVKLPNSVLTKPIAAQLAINAFDGRSSNARDNWAQIICRLLLVTVEY
jgi:hypothetical protein